jgi:hypothetical protein
MPLPWLLQGEGDRLISHVPSILDYMPNILEDILGNKLINRSLIDAIIHNHNWRRLQEILYQYLNTTPQSQLKIETVTKFNIFFLSVEL